MAYLNTPEEKAAEVKEILTMPWPLEPFLPMKRQGAPGNLGDCGFIYRGQLDRIYLVALPEIFSIEDTGGSGHYKKDGWDFFHFETELQEKGLTPEKILQRLKDIPHEILGDVAKIVDAGWIVD